MTHGIDAFTSDQCERLREQTALVIVFDTDCGIYASPLESVPDNDNAINQMGWKKAQRRIFPS